MVAMVGTEASGHCSIATDCQTPVAGKLVTTASVGGGSAVKAHCTDTKHLF